MSPLLYGECNLHHDLNIRARSPLFSLVEPGFIHLVLSMLPCWAEYPNAMILYVYLSIWRVPIFLDFLGIDGGIDKRASAMF